MRRQIVIGNWKMNGNFQSDHNLLVELAREWKGVHSAEVVICPPYPYLAMASDVLENTNIGLGAQDVSERHSGAYTGDVSAEMLADCGCSYVIVGHSERRRYHGESSEQVGWKFKAAVETQLTPILCVGETPEEHEAGKAFDVIGAQLLRAIDVCGLDTIAKGLVGYEPVWAVGTGKTASPEFAQDVHSYIREVLGPEGDQVRIIYGGSVTPQTADGLFSRKDIDGALVGGASLKAADFIEICRAAE